LTTFGCRCRCQGAVRFKRQNGSGRAVFHIELPKNMFDVFADGAGLCAENNADIVITFACEIQKRTSASRGVSANEANASKLY
jgi:hypothetical protein